VLWIWIMWPENDTFSIAPFLDLDNTFSLIFNQYLVNIMIFEKGKRRKKCWWARFWPNDVVLMNKISPYKLMTFILKQTLVHSNKIFYQISMSIFRDHDDQPVNQISTWFWRRFQVEIWSSIVRNPRISTPKSDRSELLGVLKLSRISVTWKNA